MTEELIPATPEEDAAFEAMKAEEIAAKQPEKAPEPAPEPPKTDGTPPEPTDSKPEPPKQVPHAALHEERERRRELKAENDALRAQMAQFQGLKGEIDEWRAERTRHQTLSQQQAEAEAWQTDPIGMLKRQTDELNQRQAAFEHQQRKMSEQQAQARTQAQNIAAFQSEVARHVTEFKAQSPDYDAAYQHVMKTYDKLLSAHGIPQAHWQQYKAAYMTNLANGALQQGRNPGEALYQLASEFGYVKPAPVASGAAASATLEALERAQQESRSLGSSGEAPKGELSLAEIADLPDDEFDRRWSEIAKRAS